MHLSTHLYYFPLFLELFFVSKMDMKDKFISNWWCLLHLIFYSLILLIPNGGLEFSWSHFFIPLQVLFFCFFLFALNIMGGGDAKYLSTLLILIPKIQQKILLENLLKEIICGVVIYWCVTLISIIMKDKNERKKIIIREKLFGKIPFAPFIFVAFLLIFIQ